MPTETANEHFPGTKIKILITNFERHFEKHTYYNYMYMQYAYDSACVLKLKKTMYIILSERCVLLQKYIIDRYR